MKECCGGGTCGEEEVVEETEKECCGSGQCHDEESTEESCCVTGQCGSEVTPENPMTEDEILAVSAHMAYNLSSMLRVVDFELSEQVLKISEKLLNRYDNRIVGLKEDEMEDLMSLILN